MSFTEKIKNFEVAFDLSPKGLSVGKGTRMNLRKMVDHHTFNSPVEDKTAYNVLYGQLSEKWKGFYD